MKRERKIILISLLISLVLTSFLTVFSKEYSKKVQDDLASSVIRFHVIANSDLEEDQELKRKVRDVVLQNMKDSLNNSDDINETRVILSDNIDYIEQLSREVILKWNKNYDVKVRLCQSNFPTKRYGDIVLPPGEYETLKIELGEAKGHNWWCVMFPPMCFVDATHGVVPDEMKDELKNVLTDDEYNLILATKYEDEMPIKIKFKVVEWWQEKFNKDSEEEIKKEDIK